jgi:type II secretory pathway pseudopilin PulG
MKQKRKKRSVTLIEIMIVILLIGLIGGALAFNMRGSMDKGKLFKSDQNASRVYDALMMAYTTGQFNLERCNDRATIIATLKDSALVKDAEAAFKDGWGEDLKVKRQGDDLEVYSKKAREWRAKHPGV